MRILVLADIHANWPALAAINEPFDACLFAGDLVDLAVARHGGLDVVVTCAGVQRYGTVVDTPEDVWDEVMGVNAREWASTFTWAKAVGAYERVIADAVALSRGGS